MRTITPTTPTVIDHLFGPLATPVPGPVEASSAAGLVVAPRISREPGEGQWCFTGEWQVVHAASGHVVAWLIDAGLGHAREAADILGRGRTDWTQPAELLRTDPLALDAVESLREQTTPAILEHRPVLLHDTSWRQIPPPWSVAMVDTAGDFFDGSCCWTYAQAERLALQLGNLYVGDTDESFDLTISRLSDPFWELHCARRGCDEVLCDDFPEISPHREEVASSAESDNWRQLDNRRWLCTACSRLFWSVTN
ncbi:hypothetical protein [Saccharopolyspora sp. NPDC002376]